MVRVSRQTLYRWRNIVETRRADREQEAYEDAGS
jgi:hypothetical protein